MKDRNGEDAKGKFGRILGDFTVYDHKHDRWCCVTEIMIEEGHCVEYWGQSKDDVQDEHMKNREKLLKEGVVDQKEYDKWVAKQK